MHTNRLSQLSDHGLIASTRRILAHDCVGTAELIAHLAEIDRRKLYRPAGYPAMYLYCVHEFHMSEGVAYRRVRAARVVRRFPSVLDAIADGRLHLDAVKLLATHFRRCNVDALIAAATHRTSREVAALIAERFPSPDVPTTIRLLLPSPRATAAPDASEGAASMEPCKVQQSSELAALRVYAGVQDETEVPPVPAHPAGPPPRVTPTSPGRFALQITLDQRTHDLLRRAQEMLGPAANGHDVAQVLAHALEELVRSLEHEKFATTDSPRARRSHANGRYIPAELKRKVAERDGYQCAFLSATGRRCSERSDLQVDHIVPIARGGCTTLDNLRLLCAAHNQYEAERVYGEDFMRAKREAAGHQPEWVRERAPRYESACEHTLPRAQPPQTHESPRFLSARASCCLGSTWHVLLYSLKARNALGLHALLRGAVAENGVDALDQLAGAERLGDVVVRAHLEADLLVHVATLGRQEDDRHVLGLRIGLEALARLVAVELRHHDVQHDEVRLLRPRALQRLLAVECRDHLVAFHAEAEIQDMDDVDLVVHHQDPALRHAAHLLATSPSVHRGTRRRS
jgi:5-methylcytosine-specific restriction endonuclease McrA